MVTSRLLILIIGQRFRCLAVIANKKYSFLGRGFQQSQRNPIRLELQIYLSWLVQLYEREFQ